MGGIALGLGVLWVLCRLLGHDSLELLDALAPGAMLAFGVGRIGCWLAGCCHGVVTSLPWGMPIGELGGPPRHPVQLYEAAANTLLACWALRRQRPRGATSAGTMIGYGMIRLMLEPWRDPAGIDRIAAEAPSVTQLGALVLVAAGAILRRIPLDKPAPPVGS
jgi:phosphatidylglycerol:prolipoprotein diacylglycerol transferase